MAKGRTAQGDRNGSRTHPERRPRGARHHWQTKPSSRPAGERNGRAKLTAASVRLLRQCWAAGNRDVASLAQRFGVSRRSIHGVVTFETWRLPEAESTP